MGDNEKSTLQSDPAANAPDAAAVDKGKGKGKGKSVENPDSSMDEDEESDEGEGSGPEEAVSLNIAR